MNKKRGIRHRRGEKASKVSFEVLRALVRRGSLNQSKLISEVSRALPDIDPNTVNTLVRRVVKKWEGHLLKVEEKSLPKRRFCDVNMLGLSVAHSFVSTHEYAGAVTRVDPNAPLSFKIMAQSERLCQIVDAELKETLKGEAEMLRGIFRDMLKIPFDFLADVFLPLQLQYGIGMISLFTMLKALTDNEELRKDVDPLLVKEFLGLCQEIVEKSQGSVSETKIRIKLLEDKLKSEGKKTKGG